MIGVAGVLLILAGLLAVAALARTSRARVDDRHLQALTRIHDRQEPPCDD